MGTKEILVAFEKMRAPIDQVGAPSSPGVHAIFLREGAQFPLSDRPPNGLIYVGSSGSLAAREYDMHFSSRNTGFSTLRRSIGAILKDDLSLAAIPRGSGRAESNYRNYRFKADGEERLTAWMRENLEVGVYPSNGDCEAVEKALIAALEPALCLKGWRNPSAGLTRDLRKRCPDEARAGR
jgi:hypothetical protein